LLVLLTFRLMLQLAMECSITYLPIVNIASLIYLESNAHPHAVPTETYVLVVFDAVVELTMLGWIFFSCVKARKFLASLEYLRYSSKVTGFHFFAKNLVSFQIFSNTILLVTVLGQSIGGPLVLINSAGHLSLSGLTDSTMFKFYFAVYVCIQAYCALPADTKGLFNFQHDPITDEDLRFIYQVPEFYNGGVLSVHPNQFSFSTTVQLLNWAWAVYWHGKNGLEDAQMLELNTTPIEVKSYIANPETDTHCYLCAGNDRIIVAFKGTKSMTNVQTDLDFASLRAVDVFPNLNFDVEVTVDVVEGVVFARVHRGFATAYLSIAKEVIERIMEEYEKAPRPIFFTGHSLGGALATICALDFALQYPELRSNIAATTFGSPRVGNNAFADLYSHHVQTTWRIANAGDVVTVVPPSTQGYKHVGRLVLCLPAGEIILEPGTLERRIFHKKVVKPAFHRLGCYHLAMKSYLMIYHPGTVDHASFWDWSVPLDVERLYDGAFQKAVNMRKSDRGPSNLKIPSTEVEVDYNRSTEVGSDLMGAELGEEARVAMGPDDAGGTEFPHAPTETV